jgi:D-3-phosphoglycerate dehydrogenase
MSILVKRTDSSSYFPSGFEALERSKLESIPGVRYFGTGAELPPDGDICLLTNTHTKLASWEKVRARVKLVLHPNSGHDNLVPGWSEVPLVLGNPIRAQAVAEWCLSALYQHAAFLAHHPIWPATRDWHRPLLSDRRTLIVGHGHVGKILKAHLPEAFVYDPPAGMHVDLYSGFETVILAASLTDSSRNLLDAEFFSHAPHDLLVINPARGELIDEKALRDFLSTHPQARCYLDVHHTEPYPAHYWNTPQVIATPHIAGVWQGLIESMLAYEAEVLKLYMKGELT